MLFNSYIYIFLFLPMTFICFIFLCSIANASSIKLFLSIISVLFYCTWGIEYLPLISFSILINFIFGKIILNYSDNSRSRKVVLALGIFLNLALLSSFKYLDIIINNINGLLHTNIPLSNFALPVAISFITFQQISYLCDCHSRLISNHSFLDHAFFSSFFPKLISGPIVRYNELMPQFFKHRDISSILNNVFPAIVIFSFGLFKKVIISDQFAVWADAGFEHHSTISFMGALASSFSYTFQLYFDFSGYTDMAIGSGLLFGISLPINFNSPFKASNIREFWRRWHMTLMRFLRDYLYVPLGGNKKGFFRSFFNVYFVFFICFLWHGACWTNIIFGSLHALALIIHAIWHKTSIKLNKFIGWFITFNFFSISLIIYRAKDISVAIDFFKALFGCNGFYSTEAVQAVQHSFLTNSFKPWYVFYEINGSIITAIWIAVFLVVCIFFPNTNKILEEVQKKRHTGRYALLAGFLFIASILFFIRSADFIYARL